MFLWHFPAGFPGWALPTALALWCPDFPREAHLPRLHGLRLQSVRPPWEDLGVEVQTTSVDPVELEREIGDVGRALVERFPATARHPIRAIDERLMQLSSQDRELRAALFRLVDVTPACRSLDDLARHLSEYLDEVGERPPPVSAAMRATHTRAGRRALGAAASLGIKHMAHRFIVGESTRDALPALRGL